MVVEKDEYTHAESEETSCRLVYEILDKYRMVSCSALIDPLRPEQKTAQPDSLAGPLHMFKAQTRFFGAN